MNLRTLIDIQDNVRKVHASPALLDYLQDLLDASRQRHITGLSPRAGPGVAARLAGLGADAWTVRCFFRRYPGCGDRSHGASAGHDIEQPGQSGRTLADTCFTPCRSRESRKTSARLSNCRFCGPLFVLGAMWYAASSKIAQQFTCSCFSNFGLPGFDSAYADQSCRRNR